MKRILKWLAGLLVVVLLLGAAFFVHVWYFKPYDINWFFARTAIQFVKDSPETLSSLRILEPLGIDGHNDDLNDNSLHASRETLQMALDARETLMRYDDADLNSQDLMSKRVAMALLDIVAEGQQFQFHNYPVNQLFGVQSGFPDFMATTHQINDEEGAEDYVTRLTKAGVKFDQVLEGLHHRERQGILPPKFVITRVIDEMQGFVDTPVTENILHRSLMEGMEEAGLSGDSQQRIAAKGEQAIREVVYPAYHRLIDYFQALAPQVDTNHGVWALPDGDQFYELALQFFTTTDYTADEIHRLGLAEVDRIQGEIVAILAAQGEDPDAGFEALINKMADDPRFYYPDTDQGREQILADYAAIIDEIEANLGDAFDIRPKADVEVKRISAFREKTAPGAYYNSPSMDGSRPGTFYANLYDIKATPKYGMRTLAYHEAVPGHHFQRAIQQELEGIPFFRKLAPFTAYAEGWALYAERLAWELGFQENPYDNIGRLQAELFRAVRLVVDTGIHAKRWTREQAIDYMKANTGMAQSDVVAEIERYFVMPGQATSYKVGMMKILQLRTKAKQELGDRFSLAHFHNAVLTVGAVPLTILEDVVDQYIADVKSS